MACAFAPLCLWAVYKKDPQVPALSLLSWLLACIPLVQLAVGQVIFAGDAWMASLYLAGFGASVLAGFRYLQTEHHKAQPLASISGLWIALVLACIISVGIAVHQWLDLRLLGVFLVDLPPGARVFANLAQPNQFSTLLLLGLTGLLFLFEGRKIGAVVAVFSALLLVFALVMTGSRSAVTAVAWFWFLYLTTRKKSILRTSKGAAGSITAFYVLCALLWPNINHLLFLDESAAALANRIPPGIRTVYWESMVDAVWRAPWWGYGWGQIPMAQQAVALEYASTHTFFESAHNLFLDLALWNGLLIAVPVIVLLTSWFATQYRQIRDPLSWCLLLGIGFVFSHAMVEFPLNYSYFLLPVGFFMGALSAVNTTGKSPSSVAAASVLGWLKVPVTAGALAILVLVSIEYPAFESDWQAMQYAERRIGDHSGYVPPRAIVLTQLEQLMRFIRTPAKPLMPEAQLEWMKQVSTRYGYSSALYKYALAAALNDDVTHSVKALQMICSLHPVTTCDQARDDWNQLTIKSWPQLSGVPFPRQSDDLQ